nr:hypothetical protein yrvP - Bacillus subtilis [Bacillus subtilis]
MSLYRRTCRRRLLYLRPFFISFTPITTPPYYVSRLTTSATCLAAVFTCSAVLPRPKLIRIEDVSRHSLRRT